jgi:benzoyl-CoA 2,3-dioxygenase component B
MSIDYAEKIPNNVELASDRTLQRALEQWQPNYIQWWHDMGPDGAQAFDIYLRTAVSVDPQGWAQFGYVKMPDYRWGIFLNPAEKDRKIHFGDHKGEDAWQDVPGEYRANLRRIIVTQGDTEPASVEQQRQLGLTCPSQYDLRNLFKSTSKRDGTFGQWCICCTATSAATGREEAEALLERRSGQPDNPRILQAFNEATPDWLSFFMFTYFTDRDGKFPAVRIGRVELRSARTHDQIHADGGSAPHVRRGIRGQPRHSANVPSDERPEDRRPREATRSRGHRPADPSALPEFPLQRDDRSLRRGREQQCRHVLQHRAQGRFEEGKRTDDHLLKNQSSACYTWSRGNWWRSRCRC